MSDKQAEKESYLDILNSGSVPTATTVGETVPGAAASTAPVLTGVATKSTSKKGKHVAKPLSPKDATQASTSNAKSADTQSASQQSAPTDVSQNRGTWQSAVLNFNKEKKNSLVAEIRKQNLLANGVTDEVEMLAADFESQSLGDHGASNCMLDQVLNEYLMCPKWSLIEKFKTICRFVTEETTVPYGTQFFDKAVEHYLNACPDWWPVYTKALLAYETAKLQQQQNIDHTKADSNGNASAETMARERGIERTKALLAATVATERALFGSDEQPMSAEMLQARDKAATRLPLQASFIHEKMSQVSYGTLAKHIEYTTKLETINAAMPKTLSIEPSARLTISIRLVNAGILTKETMFNWLQQPSEKDKEMFKALQRHFPKGYDTHSSLPWITKFMELRWKFDPFHYTDCVQSLVKQLEEMWTSLPVMDQTETHYADLCREVLKPLLTNSCPCKIGKDLCTRVFTGGLLKSNMDFHFALDAAAHALHQSLVTSTHYCGDSDLVRTIKRFIENKTETPSTTFGRNNNSAASDHHYNTNNNNRHGGRGGGNNNGRGFGRHGGRGDGNRNGNGNRDGRNSNNKRYFSANSDDWRDQPSNGNKRCDGCGAITHYKEQCGYKQHPDFNHTNRPFTQTAQYAQLVLRQKSELDASEHPDGSALGFTVVNTYAEEMRKRRENKRKYEDSANSANKPPYNNNGGGGRGGGGVGQHTHGGGKDRKRG